MGKGRTLDYPITVQLNADEKTKCQHDELKKKGEFQINTIHNGCLFVAYMMQEGKPPGAQFYMSELTGQSGGICDYVETEPGYRQCGLAKYLMKACFEDEKMLGKENKGFDVRKEYPGIPYYWLKEKRAKQVYEYCKTITFTSCQVDEDDTTNYACIAYIRAAKLANFDILFSLKGFKATGIEMKDVEKMFTKENADKFIKDYGEYWFFCKCLDKRCMALVD